MISRRNFLKGLLSGAAAVGLSPYMPKVITSVKSVNLHAETIKPLIAGERIRAGNAVYMGNDGRIYNATGYDFFGIALEDSKEDKPLIVGTHGIVWAGMLLDKPYYLKRGG